MKRGESKDVFLERSSVGGGSVVWKQEMESCR